MRVILLDILLLATVMRAQDRPQFAAASVKECAHDDSGPKSISSPVTLMLGCSSMWRLVTDAYWWFEDGKVQAERVASPLRMVGEPDWYQTARFTIDAKTDAPVPGAVMFGPMMRSLLEDRFHMQAHWETREGPAYLMTVAKGGPKLKEWTGESCQDVDPSNLSLGSVQPPANHPWCLNANPRRKEGSIEWDVRGATLDWFAARIGSERPVLNRTGLTARYDFVLKWQMDPPDDPKRDPNEPRDLSIFHAIRDQLGLDIRPGRGHSRVFVIDHLERPAAN